MVERALVTLLLSVAGYCAFAGFRYWHMKRAGGLSQPIDRPTVLYFSSADCAPCVVQSRYLGHLENRFRQTVAFQQIEADRDQEVAAQFNVFTVPTILILDRSGTVRHANYGLTDPQRLVHQLEKIL